MDRLLKPGKEQMFSRAIIGKLKQTMNLYHF